MSYELNVHIHKTVLMQRLLDATLRGYHWHISGTIPIAKAERLAAKFAERYQVHYNANQRAYAKLRDRANARLFVLYQDGDTDLHWWLLATEGEGRVHAEERLLDARLRRERLRLGDDYELLPLTKPRAQGGGTTWTWRMTRACYGRWVERVRQAGRYPSPREAQRVVQSLHRTPGFSGIRRQVGHLTALLRREWRRRHGTLGGLPTGMKLPYVERLTDTAVPLSALRVPNREG
jgi:hypothetical protein